MIKKSDPVFLLQDGTINLTLWLDHIAKDYSEAAVQLIRNACALSQLTGEGRSILTGVSCFQHGLATAALLHDLKVDEACLAASIVFSSVEYADLEIEDVKEQLGDEVSSLVAGVSKMSELDLTHHKQTQNHRHIENLRKMLVTMVEDVRVVLIKLAERTCFLKATSVLPAETRQQIAKEMMDIYAPLSNRLGVYQVKWQLEDEAFSILEPEIYREIANSLDSHQVQREQHIAEAVAQLQAELTKNDFQKFTVNGRAKHIYSIYRKMQRKRVGLEKIYDVLAIRVLTQSIEDCYGILGIVHSFWQQIPQEFDDYIATPKPNGYQSIHTAVIGPQNKNLEVQIRTLDMHRTSELGVAAHWHYKQGGKKPTREGRIAWLRQVLDWQRELAQGDDEKPQDNPLVDERVYVFTPTGEIIDLPLDATPLDFAYQIHSEVGHRCRGAKVNGSIVTLNYHLKTGEQVEILTAKYPQPSRDWINPHLGYLSSSRARAKVLHWFKQQDHDNNVTDGNALLQQELHRLGIDKLDWKPILDKLHYKSVNDLAAAIGCGDLRITQVVSLLQTQQALLAQQNAAPVLKAHASRPKRYTGDIYIDGVGNLLTHPARCCQPVPGEPIIGYITRGKGVSIHRKDCLSILQAPADKQERLLEVQWGEHPRNSYPVDIRIEAYDRRNLMRDITAIISNENINLISLTTNTDRDENSAKISLTIEIDDLIRLSRLLDRIQKLPNIIQVKRENDQK
jgi:GTP pyrophosphokinase